ncbi:hypothetical protein CTAYLR_006006 [Chrysophaeum taylorii]|uniref:Stc1 domain-containing protein n=1 Tax=Chrysophaeum taylorii TaxID=2483200 RepID=A0AAD7U4U9_9STRA|nr:hypothetical protein CTAYLR_006006 [Chrysophaeum taylorii]
MKNIYEGVSHAGVAVSNWAGDFECSVCKRKRLIANEFSKKMQEKRRKDPTAALKCKQCVDAEAKAEQAKAAAKGPADGEQHTCSACAKKIPASRFTKPQLKKGPGKQRCVDCVAKAQEEEATAGQADKAARLAEAKREAERADVSGSAAEKLAASAKVAALEGELVTGLRPTVVGRGRGRGRGRARR